MSRERIPVMPIEWVIVENIRNLLTIKLDLKELEFIRDNYIILLQEELRSRASMEGKLRSFYNKNGSNPEVQDKIFKD
jgi:hypothetical protein